MLAPSEALEARTANPIQDSQRGDGQQTLKRPRSSSFSDNERSSKAIKQSGPEAALKVQNAEPKLGVQLPSKSVAPTIQIDGVTIRNPVLGTINERKDVVPLVLQCPPFNEIVEPTGLPTPPTDKGMQDPMLNTARPGTRKAPQQTPGASFTLPENFVVTGDINLFGCIDSKLYIFQGTLTKAHPYIEVVKPSIKRASLATLLPDFDGSPLDAIALENTQFCYSEVTFDLFSPAGLYFQIDVIFQGALEPVSNVLRDFFRQERLALHVSTYLGLYRDWTVPAPPTDLILRGSLEHISVNVLDILEFTRIGIELSLFKHDIFGIKGLNVIDVQFTAFLSQLSSGVDLSFKVKAALQLKKTSFLISGSYSKEEYAIEAFVGDLTLQDVGELFTQITGASLNVFDHDVVFNSIYLKISNKGLILSGAITVNGYSTAAGTISISPDGVYISGGIGHVDFNHFKLNEAKLDVFIGSTCGKTCTRTTKFSIVGDLSFAGIDLKVGIFTSKGADGKLNWTVYGAAAGDIKTSTLCKDLEGTFLDISLRGLAFIASNEDEPSKDYNVCNYPITKGIQFCAIIDSIPALKQLMRGSVKGIILRAAYTTGKFSLGIILPGERTISFGDNVYTGPVELEIQTGTNIKLVLKACLNVKVDTQPDPLKFALGLKASTLGASAYAQMLTDWVNPCDIGKHIKISGCALDFGIVYAIFFTTGMPGEIGLAGQLNIGKKEAKVAMKLSQNPKEQLLAASIKDLGVVDLVKFASAVADCNLPEPDDFLYFDNFDLYISTGTSVGLTEYPAGASFKGDMIIFGKRAKFDCTIGNMIKIFATIEHFELGSLKVKGATGPDPVVDIELSSSKQSLQAKLTGDINFKDFKTIANADFEVYGLMEPHLLEHILQQLEQQINSAKEACKHGFDVAKQKMEEQEAAFQATCQEAIDELGSARAIWHAHRDAINGEFERVEADVTRTRLELQAKVDEAERGWKQLVGDATRSLEQTKAEAAAAINEAQQDLNTAQRDSDDAIREAQEDLQRAREDLNNSFGSAVRDLESARREVENAQREVDNLDNEIRWIDRRIDDAPWYDCPPLVVQKGGLCAAQGVATASLTVVQGIFYAAQGIVQGAGFAAAEGAIGAAELSLAGIREVKNAALDVARATLDEVKNAQDGLIQSGIDALHAAETVSEELHVFDLAKSAPEAGEAAAQGLINGAQRTVDAPASCTEFLAFDVAEKALEFAENNTKELNLARHAVELAEGAVNLGLDFGSWAVSHGGKLVNITKVEFSGSIESLIADGPPLQVTIEGFLFGEEISLHIVWQPHFNLVEFIKALFTELWEMIKTEATDLVKLK
ncbi:hypothetical protein MMC18_009616 [Xylographa bjoerkii]|nr:hypothetical protein [Xylographa bjoerkii]